MRKATLLGSTLTLALALAAAAQADIKVGVTAAVNPQAIGQPPTEAERMLLVGSDNFADEKITTGPEGQAQLLFLDGSSLSVGPNAALKIDQYVYDRATHAGKFAISAAQGVFKLVGGAISKTDEIVITTPTATAGIRGGIANIDSRPNQPMVAQFLFGDRLRVTANGVTQEATRPGFQIVVPPGGTPQPPVRMTTAEVRATLANFQGRSRTVSTQGPNGQGGPGGAQGGPQEPPQDQALAASGVAASTGSNDAPQSLSTVGTASSAYAQTFNPNANSQLNNIITQAQTDNQSTVLINETLFGHFYCCNPFSSFDTSSLASTPNPNNNFTFSATLTANSLNFTLPVNGPSQTQNFSFNYLPGTSFSFSNLALINGDSITGTGLVSPDRQFFGIFGTVTPAPGNNCGGNSQCRFGLFAGVPTPQPGQPNGLPTSGISTYTPMPIFSTIPFTTNGAGGEINLPGTGSAGVASSPMYVAWSPITNPAATAGSDQRATWLQATLVISGTGANQQSGLLGAVGTFFQEANSTVAMGGGEVGMVRSCATCVTTRIASGIASAQIQTDTGLGNAIYGPNAETIVAVPDILTGSPGNPTTRTPAQQEQIPFDTLTSQQANNGNLFVTVLTQNAANSAPTQAANAVTRTDVGSGAGTGLLGYTGGLTDTRSGSGMVTEGANMFGGSGGTTVAIQTSADNNRVAAQFQFSDGANSYNLQFGSTTGFNDGRSSFINDQVFAARDAVDNNGNPTTTINGSTVPFSRMYMITNAAVGFDPTSIGAGACANCSFMQWGWWIGEVENPSGGGRERFNLATWVAGTLPGAGEINPAMGMATYNGQVIANVLSSGASYVAGGQYNQTWNFGTASGTATISHFDTPTFGPSGATLTGNISASQAGGSLTNQVNFATGTGNLGGSGLTGQLNGSFAKNVATNDPIAGVLGSFSVSGGSYKAAGTVMGCRVGTGC